MLGTALIVALSYSIYHYRPKDSAKATRFGQPPWLIELGKNCFFGQVIFMLALMQVCSIRSLIGRFQFMQLTIDEALLYPFSASNFTTIEGIFSFCIIAGFPAATGLLTQMKLVNPLRGNRVPSRDWVHIVTLLAVAPLIGFCLWNFFQEYGIYTKFFHSNDVSLLRLFQMTFANVLPFFLIQFIAVFAVKTSSFRLRQVGTHHSCLRDSSP